MVRAETRKPHGVRGGLGRYRPYPKYRDSGVEWLGRIPVGWRVIRNYGLFSDRREKGFADLPMYSVTQREGVIPQEDVSTKIVRPSENTDGYKRICPGDLVYNKMRMWQGAVGTSCATAIVSPAYVVCSPRTTIETRYFEYLYRTPVFVTESGRYSYGICDDMNSLRFDDFKSICSLVPPLIEQRAIAAFLDRETAKIDALIAEKERLIELLEEKRTALITHAVTKGLNPDAPMKDSGVEWLGEIPAHWEVRPLSQFMIMITYGFTNPMPVADEGPYMLTANDIGDGVIRYDTARRTSAMAFEGGLSAKSKPRKGDVLITKDGTLGRVAVADGTAACINQSVAMLRLDERKMNVDFVQNALRADRYRERMVFEAGGTAIKHIYISRLAKMPIAFPPDREEQAAVSGSIRRSSGQINTLILRVRDGIDHLGEYRTALISAAVTGKIDVREEAA